MVIGNLIWEQINNNTNTIYWVSEEIFSLQWTTLRAVIERKLIGFLVFTRWFPRGVVQKYAQNAPFYTLKSLSEFGTSGHKLGHGPNMGRFCPSCVRLVYFLRKSTDFHVKQTECQRVIFHFLPLIFLIFLQSLRNLRRRCGWGLSIN